MTETSAEMSTNSTEVVRLTHAAFMELLTNREPEREEDLGYLLYHTTYEAVINSPLCKGTIKSTQIRKGITFQLAEIQFNQDTIVEMISAQPQIGFIFYLEGHSLACVEKSNDIAKGAYQLRFNEKEAAIYANTYSEGPQHYYAGRNVKAMFIHFHYDSFLELLADSTDEIPEELTQALFDHTRSYLKVLPMGPSLLALCYSLLNNSFKGKSKEFYMEAKVIELIAHQLDSLASSEPSQKEQRIALSGAEEKKVEEAYLLLKERLANPPSLIELAKKVGLSVYRLKNGLRQQYGDTPSRILTELRLSKAKSLLEEGELNVQQVAQEIGYLSLGSFSNAFAERYGFRPSAIKRW
jgi:AraC-like DNA-binding protein